MGYEPWIISFFLLYVNIPAPPFQNFPVVPLHETTFIAYTHIYIGVVGDGLDRKTVRWVRVSCEHRVELEGGGR